VGVLVSSRKAGSVLAVDAGAQTHLGGDRFDGDFVDAGHPRLAGGDRDESTLASGNLFEVAHDCDAVGEVGFADLVGSFGKFGIYLVLVCCRDDRPASIIWGEKSRKANYFAPFCKSRKVCVLPVRSVC